MAGHIQGLPRPRPGNWKEEALKPMPASKYVGSALVPDGPTVPGIKETTISMCAILGMVLLICVTAKLVGINGKATKNGTRSGH